MAEYIDNGARLGWLIDPLKKAGVRLPARPAGRASVEPGHALRRAGAGRVHAGPGASLVGRRFRGRPDVFLARTRAGFARDPPFLFPTFRFSFSWNSTNEIPKAYEPAAVEAKWQARWAEAGCFTAHPERVSAARPAFSIVIPPPNITGVLTLGHVLNNTIQDILARRARQTGHEVLWLPGTDHAGLATQNAVEKALRKEEKTHPPRPRPRGIPAPHLGVAEETRAHHHRPAQDAGLLAGLVARAVHARRGLRRRRAGGVRRPAREGLHLPRPAHGELGPGGADGAVRRGGRIPRPQKSVALLREVRGGGRAGPVPGSRHDPPRNDHGRHGRGREPGGPALRRPRRQERSGGRSRARQSRSSRTPPWTSRSARARSRSRPRTTSSISRSASATASASWTCCIPTARSTAPPCRNSTAWTVSPRARRRAEMLAECGLLTKEEPHENNVGFSERSQVPIEPRLSEQWFLRYPKTAEALAVVRDGLIRFFPAHWEKVYAQWLENIQDWCISRQVWWGHRIPAWYGPGGRNPRADRLARRGLDAGPGHARHLVFVVAVGLRDDGRRDTRAKFYPTDVLVTGPDIIFFWVARMIIAGLEFKPGRTDGRRGQHPVPQRVLHRPDPRRQGQEDEQVAGQFARRARPDGALRRGRRALRPAAHRAAGAGHPLRRKTGRGRAQLRQQNLERRALLPDAGTGAALRHAASATGPRRTCSTSNPSCATRRSPWTRRTRNSASTRRRSGSTISSGAIIAIGSWRRPRRTSSAWTACAPANA